MHHSGPFHPDFEGPEQGFGVKTAKCGSGKSLPVIILTLFLLNTTCPVLANSVDPDQLASEEAN